MKSQQRCSSRPGKGCVISLLVYVPLVIGSLLACGRGKQPTQPAEASLRVSPDVLSLSVDQPTGLFYLFLTDPKSALTWQVTSQPGWVAVSPSTGTIGRKIVEVRVTADLTSMQPGGPPGTIKITAGSEDVAVAVQPDVMWELGHTVVDAEYDRHHEVIVTVSDDPPRLYVLDPARRRMQQVAIPFSPTAVSVRPDGVYAAVGGGGFNGFVSTVDLSAMVVERTYRVSTWIHDLVLAANGWAYLFPPMDQDKGIGSLNLTTGEETLGSSPSVELGKLHPSGDFLYAKTSSALGKYDIRSGRAQLLYQSNFGAYFDNFWISDDGRSLYTEEGDILQLSSVQSNDMVRIGRLAMGQNGQRWVWLEHSSTANRLLGIEVFLVFNGAFGQEFCRLRVYEANTQTFLETVPLPQFRVSDGQGGGPWFDSTGQFVFVNAAGSRFFVLVQPRVGVRQPTGLFSFNVVP